MSARTLRVIAVLMLFVPSMLLWPTLSGAAPLACGDTITADATLDSDLNCVGDGLIIGAANITLDLGGHTLTGTGGGAGVSAANLTGVTVRNGILDGFFYGIFFDGMSNSAITDVTTQNNGDGIFLFNFSTDNVVEHCNVTGNSLFGISMYVGSDRNVVRHCTVTANGINGIFIGGGGAIPSPSSNDNRITHNVVTGNLGNHGILVVSGSNNEITHNMVAENLSLNGISLLSGSDNNVVTHNTVTKNQSGNGNGIALIAGSNNNLVAHNLVADNQGRGILLVSGSGYNIVEHNTVAGNVLRGISLRNVANNAVTHNVVRESGLDGIGLLQDTHDNTVSSNVILRSGSVGLVVQSEPIPADPGAVDPTNNLITGNVLEVSGVLDVNDATVGAGTADTANTYSRNHCKTSYPTGLCKS